jgi:hypothetical protein
VSDRDTRGRTLYRIWCAYSRELGHTVLPWHRLGRLREAWRRVGDAHAGLPPATAATADEVDVDHIFDEGETT